MLILNSRFCLWEFYEISGSNKCRYKYEFDKHETKIKSER